MKKNLLTTLALVITIVIFANGPFEKAMGESIPAMFAARDGESLQASINKLVRIGDAEKTRWEPYYYSAFGYLRMSSMVESAAEKDKYLDMAMKEVEKGEAINPAESELEAMRGYITMVKLAVDPGSRGMAYSGAAFTSFQKAIQMNPENPRAHYLLGRMQHGTAQFMGGGNEQACGSLFKALILLDKQPTDNLIAPSWGRNETEQALKQICEGGE